MNQNDEFESPYPGTAVGKTERYTKRNPLFSQSIRDVMNKVGFKTL